MTTLVPWTPTDLQRYIDDQHIDAQIIHLPTETPTVLHAAAALNISVDLVAKTILFFVQDNPYIVIAHGIRRISWRKLGEHFSINRKKIRMGTADEVLALTGYVAGSVPPFGHRQTAPVLMAQTILQHEFIYPGGGGMAAMLKIRSSDLHRLTQAKLVDLMESETEGQA